jgi:alpha-galactosidase
MGIDVFVIDNGWFGLAGDWDVDMGRFSSGMKAVKARLDAYGMKLGLWFNPSLVSAGAEIARKHPEYIMKSDGHDWILHDIWEKKGQFYGLCFASAYTDLLIEKFTELYRTLGVTYFKWDGIYQYGCEGAGHYHGHADTSITERLDAYAYRMGLEMTRAAEVISARCPGAIVDFDVTEASRSFGLSFLSGGKYFSINNGPYYENFDIPKTVKREPETINVFFYPGAARSQICRASSMFDKIVPSVLFLTHSLPDGSLTARDNAAASLVLGGNGLWGDLVGLTEEEVSYWNTFLTNYKKVRESVAAAYPITVGRIGGTPEIHEKLSASKGEGVVVFFTAGAAGVFTHTTQCLSKKPSEIIGADNVKYNENGSVELTVRLQGDGARTVFFLYNA